MLPSQSISQSTIFISSGNFTLQYRKVEGHVPVGRSHHLWHNREGRIVEYRHDIAEAYWVPYDAAESSLSEQYILSKMRGLGCISFINPFNLCSA